MRVVVTGGAGFLGSHLCEALIARGDEVVCVDNFVTGVHRNLQSLLREPRFRLVRADVCDEVPIGPPVDVVAHLASPASPPDYHRYPIETLTVGSRGTEHCLDVAQAHHARFVLASTSEVYGDPLVHPQREDYWGNVNSIGPRSVYDESKRFAEALSSAYARARSVNVGIVRIFNTYGPRMRADDGRVVSSFITQALNGHPITIYGDGSQTRSFCYVDDMVRGLLRMIDSEEFGPINLGNPVERTVLELAEHVIGLTGSSSVIECHPLPVDDPTRRRPDIGRARDLLQWAPEIGLDEGLRRTAAWFDAHPQERHAAADALAGAQFSGARAAA